MSQDWRQLMFQDPAEFGRIQREMADLDLADGLDRRLAADFAGLRGATVRDRPVVAGGMRSLHAEVIYSLVRARRPQCIVETGVCNGVSSAILLKALSVNGAGRLVSVDLPEFTDPALNDNTVWEGKGGAAIPAGREVGWLVSEDLRSRWRLELGRSEDILPPLLNELGQIDLFIHDSEHSYRNQLFEFTCGYAALRPGGVLVATDITWSSAFDEFWGQIRPSGARRAYVDPSCAIILKS